MELHGTTHDDALELIATLAEHLPPHLEVGSPAVVTARDVLTDRGELVAVDHLDTASGRLQVGSRTVMVARGEAETTSWRHGVEVDRRRAVVDEVPGAPIAGGGSR